MKQPTLFEPPAPAFISQTDDNGREWGDFDSCLTAFRTNACTLDGKPARIIGTPRTAQYACIERWDPKELAELARKLREFADALDEHEGGKKTKKE